MPLMPEPRLQVAFLSAFSVCHFHFYFFGGNTHPDMATTPPYTASTLMNGQKSGLCDPFTWKKETFPEIFSIDSPLDFIGQNWV